MVTTRAGFCVLRLSISRKDEGAEQRSLRLPPVVCVRGGVLDWASPLCFFLLLRGRVRSRRTVTSTFIVLRSCAPRRGWWGWGRAGRSRCLSLPLPRNAAARPTLLAFRRGAKLLTVAAAGLCFLTFFVCLFLSSCGLFLKWRRVNRRKSGKESFFLFFFLSRANLTRSTCKAPLFYPAVETVRGYAADEEHSRC